VGRPAGHNTSKHMFSFNSLRNLMSYGEPKNIDIPPPGKHRLGLLFVPVIISGYCGSAGTSRRSPAIAVGHISYENRHET
jgi:hypothetical protein